jgi:uncharacterized protein
MILEDIKKQIIEAMKAKNESRVSALKMLSSAMSYEKINLQHDLTEDEELAVVKKEVKKRTDSIEAYKKANRSELVENEEKELKILMEFMPEQMSDEDLEKIVESVISELNASVADKGRVIGESMKRSEGKADGGRIAKIVNEKLN